MTEQLYPFEIHLTVHNPDLGVFAAACALHGMKPLILDLQTRTGTTVVQDVMATIKTEALFGYLHDVLSLTTKKAEALQDYGLAVSRMKIETVPWHPIIPTVQSEGIGYWEAHIQVFVQENLMGEISQIAKQHSAHLSRNARKDGPSRDVKVYTLTLRDYLSSKDEFLAKSQALEDTLDEYRFPIRKVETEYAIYDSNHTHDADWLLAA